MKCREVRDQLIRGGGPPAGVTEHLAGCPACERFASRLRTAQEVLREHHAGAEPDPAFAARVKARLPGSQELLGRAALRLLPVTLALALVLAGWCLVATPGPRSLLAESSGDDLLTWVLEPGEVQR